MTEQKIKAIVHKHSTKIFIFGMISISLLDLLFSFLFERGISPLMTFIFSFILAVYVFQKVLSELLPTEKEDT
ncbi:hypothetical protein Q4530_12000 [Colwellia sp. 1_MG-2023]|uniref:hypothetical protein n=1 Tax=unclassified Colwellia TaxID=196834 RepID=UPI001C0849FB|nr:MULTISPECIES: hypothetical protein [unclassified Colwellia]MBU2926091.1 hypothetical protein [Colwellia sp. C2M11]MDO6653232.1 hypothetical protein [Colwellia sp. 3_MG-2023]MDO6666015.1 hypothetical protein [Colwellia sp. 2_MG-2023]MDO6690499.1 hypothetical protein [Colwellia sp. 1_MG-2023]